MQNIKKFIVGLLCLTLLLGSFVEIPASATGVFAPDPQPSSTATLEDEEEGDEGDASDEDTEEEKVVANDTDATASVSEMEQEADWPTGSVSDNDNAGLSDKPTTKFDSDSIVVLSSEGTFVVPPKEVTVGDTITLTLASGDKAKWKATKKSKIAKLSSTSKKLQAVTVTFKDIGTVKISAQQGSKVLANVTFNVVAKEEEVLTHEIIIVKGPTQSKKIKAKEIKQMLNLSFSLSSSKIQKITYSDKGIVSFSKRKGTITAGGKYENAYGSVTITVDLKRLHKNKKTGVGVRTVVFNVHVVPELKAKVPRLEDAYYAVKEDAVPLNATINTAYYETREKKPKKIIENEVSVKPTYQWYEATSPNGNGEPIVGGTNATFTPSTKKSGTYYYYCVITIPTPDKYKYSGSEVMTGMVKVEVGGKATITFDANGGYFWGLQPAPVIEVEKGEKIGSLPYNVACDDKDFVGWATTASATTSDVTSSTVFTADTTLYAVWKDTEYVYTPAAGAPIVGDVIEDHIFRSDEDVIPRLYVEAESPDGGTLSYQWYKNGTAIANATDADYYPAADYSTLNEDVYYCRVTNSKSGYTSASANSGNMYVIFVDVARPLIVHYNIGTVNAEVATGSAISFGAATYSADLKVVECREDFAGGCWGVAEHVNHLFDVPANTYEWTPEIDEEDDADRFNGFSTFYVEDVLDYITIKTWQEIMNRKTWEGVYPYEPAHVNDPVYFLELFVVPVDDEP